MKSEQIGNFVVESYIEDASGPLSVPRIAGGQGNVSHAVKVSNWGTTVCDIEIDSALPSGAADFAFSAGSADEWQAAFQSMATSDVANEGTALHWKRPMAGRQVRVHCVKVRQKKSSKHRWNLMTGNLPISVTVDIT